MTPLHPDDLRLLAGLDEDCGYSTRDAAENAGLPVGRRATLCWSLAFAHMSKVGLVARLDDKRPFVWVRTPAGTAELATRAETNQREDARG